MDSACSAGFWASLGSLPSAIAIILSAGLGAYLAWRYHRHVSALKGTLDFVTATEVASSEWVKARSLFRKLFPDDVKPRPDYSGQITVTDLGEGHYDDDIVLVSIYLGHFEFVASAIKHGAIQEDLYKAWNKSAMILTWTAAERYVKARREKNDQPTLYLEFEKLANKWSVESDGN